MTKVLLLLAFVIAIVTITFTIGFVFGKRYVMENTIVVDVYDKNNYISKNYFGRCLKINPFICATLSRDN